MSPPQAHTNVGDMATSGSCHLLGGVFAEGVQATLAVIALLSLVVKWRCESPRRLALVWVMDVSKQAGSGLFAHCLNLAAAELLSLGSSIGDQVCAWVCAVSRASAVQVSRCMS